MATITKTWTKELVQEHAKAAVMVEMYTLPFYLTVLSSIKDKNYSGYSSILSICIEEMLHLQLAANLCIALDTQPIFTAPKYDGTPIPYLDPKNPTTGHHKLINVKLDSLNETTLDLMLDIETPNGLEEDRHPEDGVQAIIHCSEDTLEERWNMERHTTPQYPYNSIGEMYEALVAGIKVVGENQFSWKTTNQQALWAQEKEKFTQIIASFENAEDAIKTISLQGEGTTSDKGSYAIPSNYRLEGEKYDSDSLNEYSHYERLLKIRNQQGTPDGKFPDVYTTTDSSSSKEQQDALQALQSGFADLLTDLDSIWNKGKHPNDSDINFWKDMCNLLQTAEDCWNAGVIPKWSVEENQTLWVTYGTDDTKIASGMTTPGATDWKVYQKVGIYVDVDTSAANFTKTPVYVTSIGGDSHHWSTTGGSAVYRENAKGFSVYIRWIEGSPTGEELTPEVANNYKWHINWMAFEPSTTKKTPFPDPKKYYRLVNKKSGKCIDVPDGSTANEVILQQWENLNNDNQQWQFQDADEGYYYIVSKKSGKFISVTGGGSTANGALLHQYEKADEDQKWRLEDAGDGYFHIINKKSNKFISVTGGGSTANGADLHQYQKADDDQKWKFEAV